MEHEYCLTIWLNSVKNIIVLSPPRECNSFAHGIVMGMCSNRRVLVVAQLFSLNVHSTITQNEAISNYIDYYT